MNLDIYEPYRELYDLFFGLLKTSTDCFMDEDHKNYYLSMDLPGIKKEDIKIDLKEFTLTVSAESKGKFLRKFSKSFKIPSTVKVEDIEASLIDGVLTLTLPKSVEKTRLIQIK